MKKEQYTAKELVDLALAGHYCIRDRIDHAIRAIYRLWGAEGRQRMNQLPDLSAYANEPEIDDWQTKLLVLLAEAEASAAARERERAVEGERGHLKLWKP
jgi:hypothetical protein